MESPKTANMAEDIQSKRDVTSRLQLTMAMQIPTLQGLLCILDNYTLRLQVSEPSTNEKELRAGLFRVLSSLKDDTRVLDAKWRKLVDVGLEYIKHVLTVWPSLFIPIRPVTSAQTSPNTDGADHQVTMQEGYGLICLVMNYLLQLLTHPAEETLITMTRSLLPAIFVIIRPADPVTFRSLLAELIYCLGDLTQLHESFFQDIDYGYKVELKRFHVPNAMDDAVEEATRENLKKCSVVMTTPAACECLQANICEVLHKLVLDVSRLSLESGCHSESQPPDLLWACVCCQIENGELHLKTVSLSLASSLLCHCGVPRGQVQLYLINLLVELIAMLCRGFDKTDGSTLAIQMPTLQGLLCILDNYTLRLQVRDYISLEENLGECLMTLVSQSRDIVVPINTRQAIQASLLDGLMEAVTDNGLHQLRTPALKNAVCVSLSDLIRACPRHDWLHNELLTDRCRELSRTLVEEVEELGRHTNGVALCLRELILLELPATFPSLPPQVNSPTSEDKSTTTSESAKSMDMENKPLKRKRKLSTGAQSTISTTPDAEPSTVDIQTLSRTLHHVIYKMGKLSARFAQDDFLIEMSEGVLCGIWLLLETVVHCVSARPYPPIPGTPHETPGVSPVKSQHVTPTPPPMRGNLCPWVGSSCVANLCAVWTHVLLQMCYVTPPKVKADNDAQTATDDHPEVVSGIYHAIVRSIGALISVQESAQLSAEVYTNMTSLLSLHWMPNEMSWVDLKPANRPDIVRISGTLADTLNDAVVAEAVTVLSLLPKDSASKWRIHVLKAAAVAPSVSVRVAAIAGFPFLLHHCGPNTNHLVYDVLHEVLNKQDPLVMAEVANIIGPLACVVSRKAVLHHVLPDSPTKLSYQNISIQCVCCDSLPASEQCEGPRDRPKIVDPNMFNPFLSLLKTPEMHIKLKVIGSLRRLFGHISVRSNNPATVAMMEACLQLIEHPEHRVRMAFSNVVGCFVGSDLSDTASETDQRLHSALMSAATKAEKDGNLPVVETILITMGQLGRKVTSDLFFIIIVCFLDGICNPFSPLTSSIAKTQLKQMATYKGIEMKELFVQYGRKISKLVADHCLEVFTKVKCDPLEVVEEMADLFGFDSSKAFLRHTEQYMLPHLVLNGTTHASHLIRIIAKALGDPNHKNPLARNINSIFSELAISKNENELVKAVAFLEAETDWSLPTILRLGQHVDSELLLHLSTNYLEVLRGIKIYLRELGFTQNEHITDEQVADMLQPKLLGILVHFDNHLNNGTIPLHEKKQVFESVILLMKLMGPKHITSVRVRLMTTLRIGMKFGMKDQGFQELCCRAWNCFVHSIDVTALGPMLAQIVVSLQPLLKIFPKQVASILGYLIIDNRSGLDHHFHELYFVPERPELADVNAVLHDYTQAKSNAGFEQQVEQLLKGISHESQDVRTLALSKLRGLLRANHEQLHRLIGATETADPVISHLITALLAGCRESDQTFRILFGECLGELGAIDPGRLELMSSASKDEVTKFHSSVAEDLFAVDLINTLAKAFLRAEERGKQDCVAFAIQELIRAYGMGPDSSTPEHGQRLWSRFSDEVQEIMEPLTRSKYSLNMAYDWSSLHKPIYRSRKGNTFTMWVTTLTCYLISKVTHGKAKQVFDTCRAVVKSDQHLALYLLPHVAVQVLLDGTRDDHNELKEEMVAVLKHAEERDTRQGQDTSDLRFMCAQCVFSLLDHFTKWIRQRIMTLSYKDLSSRSKAASTTERPPSSEDAPYQAVFGFLGQIQEDILARASLNCGAYMRALMHIEQFIKLHPERLGEHLDFQQKLYVALDEPDGVAGITATKTTRPTLSEQILAYQSIDQLSDASVCFDQVIQQEPGDLSYRQGLLQCRLALGELQSTMDLANGMIADRPIWGASLNAYRVEAAWKLGQWNKLGQFLKAEGQSHGWTVGLGKVLYAVKMRNEPEFVDTLQRLRDGLMTPLSAASMEVGSYHRGYESIVRLHMLNELEQGVKCLVGFPRDPPKGAIDISSSSCSNQDAPLTVDQLKQQWESRLQFTQSAFRTQEPILTLRRTLLSLGREERNLQLDKNIGQCWLQTAKVARECRLLQTAHSSLVSAAAYDLAHISVEQAKWLWDRGDYDMAQSTLEKALEQHYPHRSEFKSEDTSWEHEDRFECAQMLLLLSQYCEETASMESNLMLKQYKEVHKVLNDWEDGYFFLAKYYDKMMTKLISNDRPEKKGDFVLHVVQHFGNSLLYGNQYIYESMPRMLSLWLDYGAEVVEYQLKMKNEVSLQGMRAMLSQLNKSMSNYTNKLAPYQFLTAFPQLTSRICHAHPDVFSQLCDLIAKLLVEFPQQTMWMMMAVSKSSYQIRMKRCQEIFAKAKGLRSELTKFLQDATKLTDRLLDLCNRPCEPSLSTLSIKQNFKQLLRVITDNNFSSILLPLQSLMTVTLPGNTTGSTSHDPFPMDQVYIKDIEDTVELLPSLQRPKKITMRGSDGKLYVMLAKPKDDLRKDARLMEFNTIINKFLRKNYESRRRDLHIRTFTVTPLNEECGLLEWVSNTSGFRNILMKLYREKNMYTNGKELRSMALPANAPKQRKLEMYKDKLLRRHPAVFSDWFLKTFPDPTSWYNARLSYARTTGVMSIVGYILGLGDRHGENILFDSTNGDVVHVDFSCLFNKGESFDFPEIVPFRLTHNMVEAMGPTGVEGVFRRACEVTLRVMRNQSDPLMSVLKTFIYDPLVEWSKPAKGRSESGEIKNEKGYMHVNNIELRLKGLLKNKAKPHGLQLSVEGHVNHLIKEATDENNLCQMYIGWAPYM